MHMRVITTVLGAALSFPATVHAESPANPAQSDAAPTALPLGDSQTVKASLADWDRPAEPAHAESRIGVHLHRPLGHGFLSSSFGVRSDPMTGESRAHLGLDIAAPLGTPIYAAEDGIVSFAGVAGGYGRLIQIDHGEHVQTRYGHLLRILIRPGESVRRGETIGLVGSTGRSTGSHLHFEVRIGGTPVDPEKPLPTLFAAALPTSETTAPTVHWRGWSYTSDRLPSAF